MKSGICMLAIFSAVFHACLDTAKAQQIIYKEAATISGSLNGIAFTNVGIVITGTGLGNVHQSAFYSNVKVDLVNNLSFALTSGQSGLFTDLPPQSPDLVFKTAPYTGAPFNAAAGFAANLPVILGTGSNALTNYSLGTTISPQTGAAIISPGLFIPTSAGILLINSAGPSTFAANTATPTLPPRASGPVNFNFPLSEVAATPLGQPAYYLVTQAGGLSSDGSTDPFHTGGGYYALDFGASEKSNVVASASGIVTRVLQSYGNNPNDPGPVVVIYNGNGYFTEYREFTANPTIQVGDYVTAGQKIGDFIPGNTNPNVDPGSDTALHFQVKYTPGFTSPCTNAQSCSAILGQAQSAFGTGIGLSAASVSQLQNATLNGQLLTAPTYMFDVGASGRPIDLPKAVGAGAINGGGYLSPLLNVSLDTFGTVDTTIAGSTAMLVEHSPAYLWSELDIPINAKYMSFEYFWANIGDGDYLTVFFGNNLLFSSLGLDFSASDFISSGLIDVSRFAGQTDQLLFWLNPAGEQNAEVDVRDITFSGIAETPLPSTFLLFLSGLGALGFLARLKRHLPPTDQLANVR